MYIIHNKTKGTATQVFGNFPDLTIELNNGDKIIVVSTYTDTVKIPYSEDHNGELVWDWDSYPLSDIR